MKKDFLTYEEFGAKGDGINDDFDAIIACHEKANEINCKVCAKPGATYYIGGANKTAVIKTDVDFSGAKIVIDDRKVEKKESYDFTIASDYEKFPIKVDALTRDAKTLKINKDGNYFVRITNANKKIYIRKGLNMNNGTSTADVFLVDSAGNISPSIDWDYDEITEAYARCTDDTPITVTGGTFVTIANNEESFYRYYQRGFGITRSHVTLTDLEHYVEGEGDHGAPYHGFIRTDEAYDVTIKNAILTPRFIYWTASKIPGKPVPMGSYDLSFWNSIDIRCLNITQSISILDTAYWGIYTSNFCKNLLLEDCTFSRFDAHQGVTNATIRRCKLGHQRIQLIGHGEFLIEDTEISTGITFISLRSDYGSLWDGNITIRNCKWKPNTNKFYVLHAYNTGDHDYGFPCMMAKNVTIENLFIDDTEYTNIKERACYVLHNANFDKTLPFCYIPPKNVSISNITTASGLGYEVCNIKEILEKIKVN